MKHEVPKSCRDQDLAALGEPKFLSRDANLSLGLSLPERQFHAGSGFVLQLWALNPSADTSYVSTCTDLGFFRSRGFDICDASGHRVFSKWEAGIREHCKTNPAAARTEWITASCAGNVAVPIAAGACVTAKDSNYSIHLNNLYDLPLGEYIVHLRPDLHADTARLEDICAAPPEPVFAADPNDLRFTVVRPRRGSFDVPVKIHP